MKNVNRQHTTPVKYARSKRNHAIAKIGSCKPGLCVPIAAIPMFRGDGITGGKANGKWSSSRISFAIEMAETKDLIVNPVRARITAYCVPFLAFERFKGSRDELDRSYAKVQGLAGQVIPFIETHAFGADGTRPVYDMMGLHGKSTDQVSTMYLEAYNEIWNYRAKNRSEKIALRTRLQTSLAPAFWPSGRFEHLVSDFDAAVMEGEVALDILAAKLPVLGIGFSAGAQPSLATNGGTRNQSDGSQVANAGSGTANRWTDANSANNNISVKAKDTNNAFPDVWAELAATQGKLSLARLDMVKQVQAFAAIRAKYDGLDDDYIIDTYLMNGLEIPDEAMKRPFLIADQTATFSQAKRYATNSGALAESAVSGVAYGDITLRVPRLDTGGIVIVQVEILPDQLWERQRDPFFHSTDQATWPEAMRDAADPYKVDLITNGEIDTDHATPAGLFGWAPLNWIWNAFPVGVGGKFRKPTAGGGTNVLRQRFWAHETANPQLAESFYLCKGLPTNIFLDETQDPFDFTAQGNVVLDGLTQFGGALVEATDNYDQVMAEMDLTAPKAGA